MKTEIQEKRNDFCVEDDRNIRELVVYTLSSTGMEAEGFEDGEVFLKLWQNGCQSLFYLILCCRERMAWPFSKS